LSRVSRLRRLSSVFRSTLYLEEGRPSDPPYAQDPDRPAAPPRIGEDAEPVLERRALEPAK
jgi:hypothetical protein